MYSGIFLRKGKRLAQVSICSLLTASPLGHLPPSTAEKGKETPNLFLQSKERDPLKKQIKTHSDKFMIKFLEKKPSILTTPGLE
jgi:hypothetical protein